MSVKIYSTKFCPWCRFTKEFLKKHKIRFKEIDVGKSAKVAKEMIHKSHQTGVPVIDVNGKIIVGFNKGALKKALKLK